MLTTHAVPGFSISPARGRNCREAGVLLGSVRSSGSSAKKASFSCSTTRLVSVFPHSHSHFVASASSPSADPETDMAAGTAGMAELRQKMQAIINANPKGGWDKVWQDAMTPWDLGGVTPAVSALLSSGAIPESAKSVMVPGCGSGYDVVAFTEGGKRKATGLDISDTALTRARELAAGKPGHESVTFLNADFFSYSPEEPFDVIFDYTFFCAIEPRLRKDWARRTASNLAPGGTLFTLAFPIGEYEGGPPYAVSVKAYEELLNPLGLHCEELPTVSHPSREGKEKLLMWTRHPTSKV